MSRFAASRAGSLAYIGAVAALLAACSPPPTATVTTQPTRSSSTVVRIPSAPLPSLSTATAEAPLPSPLVFPPTTVPSAPPAPSSPALLPAVSPLPPVDLAFSGARALDLVNRYMELGPRDTGSPGWQRAGDFIVAELQAAGWQVEEQRFPYQGVQARNIIARRGSGPILMLGAHYDGRKYADRDPDPAKQRDPMPGANDGASGVAALLELARHIDPAQLGREVQLVFFDAEDNGGIDGWEYAAGSAYMAENLQRRPEALVLLDMIGDADLQVYQELNSTSALSQSIWATAAELGYRQFVPEVKYAITDDHTAFLAAGIPAVDLIDFDYPHWHTTADTADKVSAASLEAVGRTVERWLETRARP